MRIRVFVPLLLALVVPLAALSTSPAGAANGIALLTDVQAQNMGDFDRVTFTFEGGVPQILQADYFDGPAALQPSDQLVSPALAGPPRLAITMSGASSFDTSVDPAVPSYTGPTRFSPNLPKVIELMQVQDFEATLTWDFGLRGAEVPATARVVSNPTQVIVDIPHDDEIVTVAPSFTG